MRRFEFVLAALLCLAACGPRQGPYVAKQPIPAGTPTQFDVIIQNNSLWVLDVGNYFFVNGTRQSGTVFLPPGDHFVVHVGFLPSSVTVNAVSTGIPQVSFAPKLLVLGRDYDAGTHVVSVGFPYP